MCLNYVYSLIDVVMESMARRKGLFETLTLLCIGLVSFGIRLFSVIRYESIIHEFDPWFNYRATRFLVDKGWDAFINWFDDTAWYPLGRVVGGTLYPGIMLTSAAIWQFMNNFLHMPVDIRNVCVLLAPCFSGLTAAATYLVAKELKDSAAGLLAAAFIAVAPGYISRSVAGSYDNEAIAIFLMMGTFYLWLRAVRTGSVHWALATAISYYWMVASWGGYVFLINLIPLHAFTLLLLGRFTPRLYKAYSSFYVMGTLASMTVKWVNFQPTSTSEHMAALGVFGLFQLVAFAEVLRSMFPNPKEAKLVTRAFLLATIGLGIVAFIVLSLTGRVAPWAGRFYSMWNTEYAKDHMPIIASVSEHQPTTWASFFLDLNMLVFLLPAGLFYCFKERKDAHVFAIMYALTASYFAGVMIRLILTLTPLVCVLAGVAVSHVFESYMLIAPSTTEGQERKSRRPSIDTKLTVLAPLLLCLLRYVQHCVWVTSSSYSSPSVIMATRLPNGQDRIIDDFREAYQWLRVNTPADAKILAWWDYGYQLAGMADRTTIVDNNTWNNEHIALVGRILASNEAQAWPLLRQLDVDYVLVLVGAASGFSGDDMNKFLWMIRIAQGVFPKEVQESAFYNERGEFRVDKHASKTLRESLLYKLSYYGMDKLVGPQGVDRVRQQPIGDLKVKLSTLTEAYSTENLIVRLYKVNKPDNLGSSLLAK